MNVVLRTLALLAVLAAIPMLVGPEGSGTTSVGSDDPGTKRGRNWRGVEGARCASVLDRCDQAVEGAEG